MERVSVLSNHLFFRLRAKLLTAFSRTTVISGRSSSFIMPLYVRRIRTPLTFTSMFLIPRLSKKVFRAEAMGMRTPPGRRLERNSSQQLQSMRMSVLSLSVRTSTGMNFLCPKSSVNSPSCFIACTFCLICRLFRNIPSSYKTCSHRTMSANDMTWD